MAEGEVRNTGVEDKPKKTLKELQEEFKNRQLYLQEKLMKEAQVLKARQEQNNRDKGRDRRKK